MIFLFFYLKGGFFQIINSLFLFNFYLGEKYPKEKIFDFNLIFLILLFLLFALFIIFKNKQIRRTTLLLSFFISALIFPFLKYARYHIVPIVPFFLLIMAKGYGIQKKNLVNFFRISILFFLVFLIIKIKNQYFLNQKRVVWQNSIDYKVVYQLKELKIENKKILIIGDHGEFYIYLNKIPPTYFPLIFNFVPQYFPFFYDDYLKALNRVDFLLVFINDKSAKEVLKNKKIKDFINKKFKKVIKEKNYLIYLKN